jgi:hypothetical protein
MMSTSVRIISTWVAAFGAGFLLKRLLPEFKGVLVRGRVPHFIGYNGIAFWACMLAGLVATAAILVKSMGGGRR